MTEEELRRRGYYLFAIDNGRFVQVRELKTDKMVAMGYGQADALRAAEKLFDEADEAEAPTKCYNVELTMTVTVSAQDHQEAEERAVSEAAAKLDSQGIGCLIVQPAEETECDG